MSGTRGILLSSEGLAAPRPHGLSDGSDSRSSTTRRYERAAPTPHPYGTRCSPTGCAAHRQHRPSEGNTSAGPLLLVRNTFAVDPIRHSVEPGCRVRRIATAGAFQATGAVKPPPFPDLPGISRVRTCSSLSPPLVWHAVRIGSPVATQGHTERCDNRPERMNSKEFAAGRLHTSPRPRT